jgi:hypothetical protein
VNGDRSSVQSGRAAGRGRSPHPNGRPLLPPREAKFTSALADRTCARRRYKRSTTLNITSADPPIVRSLTTCDLASHRLQRSRARCRRWPPDRGPDRSHLVAAVRRLQKSQAIASDGRISGKGAVSEDGPSPFTRTQSERRAPSGRKCKSAARGVTSSPSLLPREVA